MDTFWSNGYVSAKKSHQVLVKMDKDLFAAFKGIAAAEDRPLGYVTRALALRGLELYRKDALLRPSEPALIVANITSEKAALRQQFQRDLNTLPVPKKRRTG